VADLAQALEAVWLGDRAPSWRSSRRQRTAALRTGRGNPLLGALGHADDPVAEPVARVIDAVREISGSS